MLLVAIEDCRTSATILTKDSTLHSCFIIAPAETKLEPLTRIVRDAGWRVLNLESVEPGASVYLDTTTQLIEAADAVIVVLTKRDSPNTLVETGLAMGLRRPVLLVTEDVATMDEITPDRLLASLPRARAKLADGDALRFHIAAFLDGVESGPIRNHPSPVAPRATSERGSSRTSFPTNPSSQLEARLLDAFRGSAEVEAVHLEPQLDAGRRFRPDFALWLRHERQVLPNPLIVELVGQESARRGRGKRRLEQLLKYALDTGVGAVMLVEEVDPLPLSLLRLSPMMYRIGLLDLETLLQTERLVPEMVRARNFLAHSAG